MAFHLTEQDVAMIVVATVHRSSKYSASAIGNYRMPFALIFLHECQSEDFCRNISLQILIIPKFNPKMYIVHRKAFRTFRFDKLKILFKF